MNDEDFHDFQADTSDFDQISGSSTVLIDKQKLADKTGISSRVFLPAGAVLLLVVGGVVGWLFFL